jgi:hypothetical protein
MGKEVKGLTTLVSTVIIFAIVFIVGIGIWAIVTKVIIPGSNQVDLNQVTLDLELKKALIVNDSFIEVQVERNVGKGDFVGLIFIVSDGENSETIEINATLEELEKGVFVLDLKEINVNDIVEITIAPLVEKKSGKTVTGTVESQLDIQPGTLESGSFCSSNVECTNPEVCFDGVCSSVDDLHFACHGVYCVIGDNFYCGDTCREAHYGGCKKYRQHYGGAFMNYNTTHLIHHDLCVPEGENYDCSGINCGLYLSYCIDEDQDGYFENHGYHSIDCTSCQAGRCNTTNVNFSNYLRDLYYCDDSDGFDIFTKGAVYNGVLGNINYRKTHLDSCPNMTYVSEKACYYYTDIMGILRHYVQLNYVECPEICVDGRCVPESERENACEDTDGGKDYLTKGFTINKVGFNDAEGDKCMMSTNLREYYCENGERKLERFNCGYLNCYDGACISLENQTYCGDGICNGDEICNTCETDCGECGDADDYVCEDSDGGKDYFTFGTVSYGKSSDPDDRTIIDDYCSTIEPGYINEVFCFNLSYDNVSYKWAFGWDGIDCDNGCVDGACLTGSSCGDGNCNGDETCTICEVDCGICDPDPSCGDGNCNGNETCNTCETDCGTCIPDEAFCSDSDGGVNFLEKGTIEYNHLVSGEIMNSTDYCNSNWLYEYYCGEIPKGMSNALTLTICDEGCSDGACLASSSCGDGECSLEENYISCLEDCPNVCLETDDGEDYFVKGTVDGFYYSGTHMIEEDYCYDSNRVVEFYCTPEGYAAGGGVVECPGECIDGACSEIALPPSCGDTSCNIGEDCVSCPEDCGECGNGS